MSEKLSAVMPTYNRFPITLTKGEGSYVWDQEDLLYLDYTAGIGTCNLGHRPMMVEAALDRQIGELWHCSNLYTIPNQEELAKQLTEHSVFDQVFFSNSGAEANEAAIKLARRYAQKVKQTDRYEVVTFKQSFHGRTLATLSATGQEKIQAGFDPKMPGFRYLPYNDLDALEELVRPETCAVMLELIQGEGGVHPADQIWLDQLVALCQTNDLLLIVDEIQTGMGRTGTLFAYQQYGIEPDVMTLAKGLGSGFPVGAVLAKKEVAQAFTAGAHGSTFGGNPLAMAAGIATVESMIAPGFLADVKANSDYFWQELNQLCSQIEQVQRIRGKGYLIGIEVEGQAIDYVNRAREDHQLLILVAGPQVIRLLPPLNTTKEEIDECIDILGKILVN